MKCIGYNFGDKLYENKWNGYGTYYYIQDGDIVKIFNPNDVVITIESDKSKPLIEHVPDEVMRVQS